MTNTLVVATANHGKLQELRQLLGPLPVRICSLADVGRENFAIVEDGRTFAENAIKKARAVAESTMMLTLADDSGLEVDALGGEPGVRSARYAHDRATDAENNAALLRALENVSLGSMAPTTFTARFRCALALVDPFYLDGEAIVVHGTCEGEMSRTPSGSGGFGYDPLFLVQGVGKTMAELTEVEKNAVSHRGKACLAMRPVLERVLAERNRVTERISGAT